MEDLKQIQEFFSKPLEENTFIEAFKLEKALKGMGYNVKVKYLDDFGKDVFEIYFNNPEDADDDSIFYDAKKLGYDNVRVFANPQESLDEAYIVTYAKNKGEKPASAAYKLRGSALAFMRDLEKDGYTTMLTQRPVDGVDETVEEYNTGLYHDPDKYVSRNKAKKVSKSAMDKVIDAIKKAMTGDYEPSVTEAKPKKGHGEKVSKEFFSKLQGKTISYAGEDYIVVDSDDAVLRLQDEDGNYKTINFNQFNIDGLIREVMETIELGKRLDEKKLCKKGQAYRKRRMAAGEKSSAYLSGRAVKVCKGQMSGKKKKKKKKK